VWARRTHQLASVFGGVGHAVSEPVEPRYFRVEYEAWLTDGRCFRPLTWLVLADVQTEAQAADAVDADTREDARMWHGVDCTVTIHRVFAVSARAYRHHLASVHRVVELVLENPARIADEARRRCVLPTVVAEEHKLAAGREIARAEMAERGACARDL
jgi:hypothetical protein